MRYITEDDLALQSLYRWEQTRPRQVFMTQPLKDGVVREWTWGQAADEIRRIAHYLKAQNWEPGTRVAILSRNCAWWMMADWRSGWPAMLRSRSTLRSNRNRCARFWSTARPKPASWAPPTTWNDRCRHAAGHVRRPVSDRAPADDPDLGGPDCGQPAAGRLAGARGRTIWRRSFTPQAPRVTPKA